MGIQAGNVITTGSFGLERTSVTKVEQFDVGMDSYIATFTDGKPNYRKLTANEKMQWEKKISSADFVREELKPEQMDCRREGYSKDAEHIAAEIDEEMRRKSAQKEVEQIDFRTKPKGPRKNKSLYEYKIVKNRKIFEQVDGKEVFAKVDPFFEVTVCFSEKIDEINQKRPRRMQIEKCDYNSDFVGK